MYVPYQHTSRNFESAGFDNSMLQVLVEAFDLCCSPLPDKVSVLLALQTTTCAVERALGNVRICLRHLTLIGSLGRLTNTTLLPTLFVHLLGDCECRCWLNSFLAERHPWSSCTAGGIWRSSCKTFDAAFHHIVFRA